MTTYVALLHSIVLGPGKRVLMADLKAMATELGFRDPRTWAATGNLIFDADDAPLAVVEERLKRLSARVSASMSTPHQSRVA